MPVSPVELEIGEHTRRFQLVQQSVSKAASFLVGLNSLRATEREGNAAGKSAVQLAPAIADAAGRLVATILLPVDALDPLTGEQASDLAPDQLEAILREQQRLNRFEEIGEIFVTQYRDLTEARLSAWALRMAV